MGVPGQRHSLCHDSLRPLTATTLRSGEWPMVASGTTSDNRFNSTARS